jgi:hypothetical protein
MNVHLFSRHLLGILLLAYAAGPSAGALAAVPKKEPKYHAQFFRIEAPGNPQALIAAIISPGWAEDSVEARALAQRGYDWVFERFRQAYPQIPAKTFAKAQAVDSPLDGRSTVVMLYREGNPADVVASMRLAFPTDELPTVPLEKATGWSIPRQKAVKKQYPTFNLYGSWSKREWQGNFVEMKNLAVAENAKIDFLPILFHAAEFETYMKYSVRGAFVSEWMRRNVDQLDTFKVNVHSTLPTQYYLYCDERLGPYYKRLGFKDVPGSPHAGTNVILGVERDGFVRILRKMNTRAGKGLLDWNRITPLNTREAYDDQLERVRKTLVPGCLSSALGQQRPPSPSQGKSP